MQALSRAVDLVGVLALARTLRAHEGWSRARLLGHQRAAFAAIVRHARADAAFYRDLYAGVPDGAEVEPAALPVTTKCLLMENFDRAVTDPRLRRADLERHLAGATSDCVLPGGFRVVASGGTSGLRGLFVYDRAAWRVVLANSIRWQRLIGVAPRVPQRVRICSVGAGDTMHLSRRIPQSGDVGLFHLLHIDATAPLAEQVAALNAFRPDVLSPYPTAAALLAREQLAGRLAIRPRVVSTHSEVLTPDVAHLIEQAWGCIPFNHYGMTEEPHVASDCPAHRGLHVFEDTCLVEIVDDDYRPVPDGQMGARWLLTNLYNRALPIIRYDVTDMLRRVPTPCTCGRPFALIGTLGGRAEDLLRLPRRDGAGEVLVNPMLVSLAVEHFVAVREYEAEHDAAGIRLRLAVPGEADRAMIAIALPQRLRDDFERLGAVAPLVTLTFVETLARSAQTMGKRNVVAHHRTQSEAGP